MNADSLFLEETMDVGAINRLLHEAAHSHRALAMRLLRASHVGSHEQSQAWTDPQVPHMMNQMAHVMKQMVHIIKQISYMSNH